MYLNVEYTHSTTTQNILLELLVIQNAPCAHLAILPVPNYTTFIN